MRATAAGLLAVLAAVTGCATVGNTPAQDLAWERWQTCNHFATITLDRIELEGRLVVMGDLHEAAPFTACVTQAAEDQRRRGASVGPQAAVLVRLYGCQGVAM